MCIFHLWSFFVQIDTYLLTCRLRFLTHDQYETSCYRHPCVRIWIGSHTHCYHKIINTHKCVCVCVCLNSHKITQPGIDIRGVNKKVKFPWEAPVVSHNTLPPNNTYSYICELCQFNLIGARQLRDFGQNYFNRRTEQISGADTKRHLKLNLKKWMKSVLSVECVIYIRMQNYVAINAVSCSIRLY